MTYFFFSSRRRHTRFDCDWSSDVCSSDLSGVATVQGVRHLEDQDRALLAEGPDAIVAPSIVHVVERATGWRAFDRAGWKIRPEVVHELAVRTEQEHIIAVLLGRVVVPVELEDHLATHVSNAAVESHREIEVCRVIPNEKLPGRRAALRQADGERDRGHPVPLSGTENSIYGTWLASGGRERHGASARSREAPRQGVGPPRSGQCPTTHARDSIGTGRDDSSRNRTVIVPFPAATENVTVTPATA